MGEEDKHTKLLAKYIQYIRGVEGTDYILIHDERWLSDVKFTYEEWEELKAIATVGYKE